MTSGNLSDEPIAHDDDDAVARLGPAGRRPPRPRPPDPHPLRRLGASASSPARRRSCCAGRGATPPSRWRCRSPRARPVLAVGAELKSTVGGRRSATTVVASHHIGDLEHLATYRSFLQAVDHLCRLYGVAPEVVAHDLHPEYLSTQVRRSSSTCRAVRGAAPPRPRRLVHGRARPHRAGARRRLRRARLRHRRHAVGRRAARRRPAPASSGSATSRRCRCPVAPRPSASRGGWRRRGRRRPAVDAVADLPSRRPAVPAVLDLAGAATARRSPPAWDACSTPSPRCSGCRRRGQLRGPGGHRARGAGRARSRRAPTRRYVRRRRSIADGDGVLVLDPAPLIAAADRRPPAWRRPSPCVAAGFHEALGRATAATAAAAGRRRTALDASRSPAGCSRTSTAVDDRRGRASTAPASRCSSTATIPPTTAASASARPRSPPSQLTAARIAARRIESGGKRTH